MEPPNHLLHQRVVAAKPCNSRQACRHAVGGVGYERGPGCTLRRRPVTGWQAGVELLGLQLVAIKIDAGIAVDLYIDVVGDGLHDGYAKRPVLARLVIDEWLGFPNTCRTKAQHNCGGGDQPERWTGRTAASRAVEAA